MEIYRSNYIIRTFDEKNRLMTSIWLKATKDMDEKEFKEEMLNLADLILKYKAVYLLSDTKELGFPIIPEIQKWIVQNIAPKFVEAKLKKQAIIILNELYAQVSMEQTIDDVNEKKLDMQAKFFDNHDDAKIWIFK